MPSDTPSPQTDTWSPRGIHLQGHLRLVTLEESYRPRIFGIFLQPNVVGLRIVPGYQMDMGDEGQPLARVLIKFGVGCSSTVP